MIRQELGRNVFGNLNISNARCQPSLCTNKAGVHSWDARARVITEKRVGTLDRDRVLSPDGHGYHFVLLVSNGASQLQNLISDQGVVSTTFISPHS